VAEISPDDAESLAVNVLGGNTTARAKSFPSGALSLDLHRPGHHAVIECDNAGRWSADADPAEAEAFTGPRHTGRSMREALEYVRDAWTRTP
jgi:hypothetical protein